MQDVRVPSPVKSRFQYNSDKFRSFIKDLETRFKDSKEERRKQDPDVFPFEKLADYQKKNVVTILKMIYDENQGALLTDETGSGKTITLIALMQWVLRAPQAILTRTSPPSYPGLPTKPRVLVVCSMNILEGPFEDELVAYYGSKKEFSKRVYWWHGQNIRPRTFQTSAWEDVEIVFTTPDTLRSEYKKHKHHMTDRSNNHPQTVYDYFWEMVVCDEADIIKNGAINPDHKTDEALRKLSCIAKVCSTATPIHNRIEELVSYARQCCPHKPWGQEEYWRQIRGNNAARLETASKFIVKATLEDIKKEGSAFAARLLNQKKCTKYAVLCKMTDKQLDSVHTIVSNGLNQLDPTKFKKNHLWPIMLYAIRACTTPYFVYEDERGTLTEGSKGAELCLEEEEEAAADMDVDEKAGADEKETKTSHSNKRKASSSGDDSPPPPSSKAKTSALNQERMMKELKKIPLDDLLQHSCKFPPMIDLLKEKIGQEKRKVIIYCGRKIITSMVIRLIEEKLGYKTARYDTYAGPPKVRKANLKRFREDPDCAILVSNSKSLCKGLQTLTVASVIMLLEGEWNPMKEKQMFARINRVGQKRDTEIYDFLSDGLTMDSVRSFSRWYKTEYLGTILDTDEEKKAKQDKVDYVFFTKHHFTVDQQKLFFVESARIRELYDSTCIISKPYEIFAMDQLPRNPKPIWEIVATEDDRRKSNSLTTIKDSHAASSAAKRAKFVKEEDDVGPHAFIEDELPPMPDKWEWMEPDHVLFQSDKVYPKHLTKLRVNG